MRLYAAREGWIPAPVMTAFEEIRDAIAVLPEIAPAERANCHALTHAFARTRGDVTPVDGHFHSRNTYHSWLTVGSVIIDVAPVGGGSPFVVDAEGLLNPWNRIYIPDAAVARMIVEQDVAEIVRLIGGDGIAVGVDVAG